MLHFLQLLMWLCYFLTVADQLADMAKQAGSAVTPEMARAAAQSFKNMSPQVGVR